MRPRSEHEKMLAGETYNFLDDELSAIRRRTKELLRALNQAESFDDRQAILRQLLGGLGEGSTIEPPFSCTYGRNTYIGDHTYLNFSCTILDNNEVRIGHHVMVGPSVQFYTAAHPLRASSRIHGWEVAKPISVADNVWLGGGVILLPGISVGRNAVVGAGAVVSRDVPANTVVAGNPATVIREIDQTMDPGTDSVP